MSYDSTTKQINKNIANQDRRDSRDEGIVNLRETLNHIVKFMPPEDVEKIKKIGKKLHNHGMKFVPAKSLSQKNFQVVSQEKNRKNTIQR